MGEVRVTDEQAGEPGTIQPAPRRRSTRWDLLFLLIAVPYGAVLLVVLPTPIVVDTPYHLLRIDQIARGQFVAPLDHGKGIAHPDDCVGALAAQMLHRALVRNTPLDQVFSRPPCGPSKALDIGNTTINSPVSYVPQVAGYLVGRAIGGALIGAWAAKLAGLAAYLALCWLAIRVAPRGKPFLFLVALLPTSMTLAVSLSADPIPIALGILAVGLLLRLRAAPGDAESEPSSRVLLGGLGACLVLLALAKNLYAPMALAVVLVPAGRFATRRARQAFVTVVLGITVLGSGLWSTLVVNRTTLDFMPFFNTTSAGQKAWVRHHPLGFARIALRSVFGTQTLVAHTLPGMVANFAPLFGREVAPFAMTVLALGLGIAAVRCDHRRGARQAPSPTPAAERDRPGGRFDRVARVAVPLVVFVMVLAIVLYGEGIAFAPNFRLDQNILFIEGRYFLPLLPLVVLLPWSVPGEPGDGVATAGWSWVVPAGVLVLAGWYGLLLHQIFY